jgi:hypothetical protein
LARAPAIIARSRDERAKNFLALRQTGNGNLCPALVTTHASMDFNASPKKPPASQSVAYRRIRRRCPHSPQPHQRRGVHDAGKPWSRRPSARTPAPSQTLLPNSDKGRHRMLPKAVTAQSRYCDQPTAEDSELHRATPFLCANEQHIQISRVRPRPANSSM